MIWCEHCDAATPPIKNTIRLTTDGHEIVRHTCEFCKRITEIEYYKGPTVRITAEGEQTTNGKKVINHKRTRN